MPNDVDPEDPAATATGMVPVPKEKEDGVAARPIDFPPPTGSSPPQPSSQTLSVAMAFQQGAGPEMAALNKLNGEQMLEVAKQQHDLQRHNLDLQDRKLERDFKARESREVREDARERRNSGRFERFAWGIFVLMTGGVITLFAMREPKEAVALLIFAVTNAASFTGGMGLQKSRDAKKGKHDDE